MIKVMFGIPSSPHPAAPSNADDSSQYLASENVSEPYLWRTPTNGLFGDESESDSDPDYDMTSVPSERDDHTTQATPLAQDGAIANTEEYPPHQIARVTAEDDRRPDLEQKTLIHVPHELRSLQRLGADLVRVAACTFDEPLTLHRRHGDRKNHSSRY